MRNPCHCGEVLPVCAWAGEGTAWQAPRCTATHKFRRDSAALLGFLLVSHLQWERSSPVTGSRKTLTAGANSHQAAGWWTAPADSSLPRRWAVEGWLKRAVLYLLCPRKRFLFPEWAGLLSGVGWRLPLACFLTGKCWFCLRLLLNPYEWERVTAEEQSGERQATGELPCAACLTLCLLPGLPAKHNIPFSSTLWGQCRSVTITARE